MTKNNKLKFPSDTLAEPNRIQVSAVNMMKPLAPDDLERFTGELYSETSGLSLTTDKKKKQIGRHRFHIALLGLAIAAVNCYAQATFCIAIVEMVLPSDFVFRGESPSAAVVVKVSLDRLAGEGKMASISTETEEAFASLGHMERDQSCPIEYRYKDYYDSWRFPRSNSANATTIAQQQPTSNTIDISDRFDWDASRQGLLLGAFAIGTAPLQVLGGRLAEIYGSKWVLLAGCLGTAITNLTIPFLAHYSFLLLIINRVVMGIAQAGMEPGLMCLMADWLTPTETGFFISMLLFAICIGFFLGSLCSSFLLTLGLGWPITYYVAGSINLAIGLLWLTFASSWPRTSKYLTPEEAEYIEKEQQASKAQVSLSTSTPTTDNTTNHWQRNISTLATNTHLPGDSCVTGSSKICNTMTTDLTSKQESEPAPWRNILSTKSVWAFIICKISIRWCADVLAIELPTYLANVLHLSIKLNGIVNSVSSALFAIFSFITGCVVNEILKTSHQNHEGDEHVLGGRLSKTNLRKLFQGVASFGSAISMFLMTQYDCHILFSMSMLLVLSCCLVMGTGGELQIPYDMTSKYPGTLHGLACTLSVSGWLAPPMIGLILGDQPSSRYRWGLVWYLSALLNFIGGLVFVLFADASPRNFDQTHHDNDRLGNKPKRLKIDDEEITTTNNQTLGGYYNIACRSQENSPTMSHNKFAIKNQHRQYFDGEPMRVRQVEASITKPLYQLSSFDLPPVPVLIYPYQSTDTVQNLGSSKEFGLIKKVMSLELSRLLWAKIRRRSGQLNFAENSQLSYNNDETKKTIKNKLHQQEKKSYNQCSKLGTITHL